MKRVLAAAMLALGSPVSAEPPQSLAQHRCYVCHSDYEAGAGPAFADVAAGYRGKRDAVVTIAHDIRAGIFNGGPWHMPPHPEISREEAKAMARYIMSLPAQEGQPAKGPGPP